jgi:glucosamine--fructose-6-phosphate aminotransferase (isomerizing)
VTGTHFEAEIREQPHVWRGIARSGEATRLARAIAGRDVVLLGSGSSLFAAQLGAFALRRRGFRARALAATEAPLEAAAYAGAAIVACSQSGESDDLLHALDALAPALLIALTNGRDSTLARRADAVVDVAAGIERAVPASKSVTATAAILLWAADALAAHTGDRAAALHAIADEVERWLEGDGLAGVGERAAHIVRQRSVIVVGAGYGLPIAREAALKLKEASYVAAEGFAAGEFLHGSAAILDRSCAIVGIVDALSRSIVARPLRAARAAGSSAYVVGDPLDEFALLGPRGDGAFGALSRLVAVQAIALCAGRARAVDSDAPRGQSKVLLDERVEPNRT